jgi:Holliday junction resolvase RusA-like endonuclease
VTTVAAPTWTPVPNGVWKALRHFLAPYVGVTFVVPGDPVPKGRPRLAGRGHVITPKATKAAEKKVREAFRDALPDWEAEPDLTYGCLLEFRTAGGSQVDLDNATKLIWDALNTVFWQDDIQVGMSFLNLVRGRGEPGVEVVLFAVENNGTRTTTVCECGTRFRAAGLLCKACRQNRATINALLRPGQLELESAELAGQQRKAFKFVAVTLMADDRSPTTAQIAEHLGVPETRARAVVNTLIADGCVVREGRKLRIVGPLKGIAS